MPDKAKIADKKPIIIDAEPGSYYWCSCGQSKMQPYCDGSHKSSDHKPLRFEVTEKKKIALCTCKQTLTPPFCDGSHKKL